MSRKNVTSNHGNNLTYQITGKSKDGIGGKGAWWNAAIGGTGKVLISQIVSFLEVAEIQ